MKPQSALENLQQQILHRAEQIERGEIDIINPDIEDGISTLELTEWTNGELAAVITIGGPRIIAYPIDDEFFKVFGDGVGVWWEVIGRSRDFCTAMEELKVNQ